MKKFLLSGILGVSLCALPLAASAAPQPKSKIAPIKLPVVTRDNFVSLELITQEREGGEVTRLTIQNGLISIVKGAGSIQARPLSNNQIADLRRAINTRSQLPFTATKTNPPQTGWAREKLILTLSDKANKDQYFTAENRGNLKVPDYVSLVEYLRAVRSAKLPAPASASAKPPTPAKPQPPKPQEPAKPQEPTKPQEPSKPQVPTSPQISLKVTPQNFDSLTLETSGGFAGIRALVNIRVPAVNEDANEWRMEWNQTTVGRGVDRSAAVPAATQAEIIRLLNVADFGKLNGKEFRQANLFDGINEVVTLTLKDGREFKVSNYGDTAPKAFSALTQYVNGLKDLSEDR